MPTKAPSQTAKTLPGQVTVETADTTTARCTRILALPVPVGNPPFPICIVVDLFGGRQANIQRFDVERAVATILEQHQVAGWVS